MVNPAKLNQAAGFNACQKPSLQDARCDANISKSMLKNSFKMVICPNCESPIDGSNSLCRYCYSAYKRNVWVSNPIARKKQIARIKAMKALKSGKIFRHECALCGNNNAEMHHPDYDKPLEVSWLCDSCHHEFHKLENKVLCA